MWLFRSRFIGPRTRCITPLRRGRNLRAGKPYRNGRVWGGLWAALFVANHCLVPAAAFQWGMSDPIPGNDPNAAYDVVPTQGWPHGWTVTCNGIPVRHFVNKTNAERYATGPEYRASLIVTKYAGR